MECVKTLFQRTKSASKKAKKQESMRKEERKDSEHGYQQK